MAVDVVAPVARVVVGEALARLAVVCDRQCKPPKTKKGVRFSPASLPSRSKPPQKPLAAAVSKVARPASIVASFSIIVVSGCVGRCQLFVEEYGDERS